MHELQEANKK